MLVVERVDLKEVVQGNEEHRAASKEDGEGVQLRVGDHCEYGVRV